MTTDESYEALADVTNTDWAEGRGQLNAALKSIREQEGLSDVADAIRERAELYRKAWPEMTLTAPALAKHWKRVEAEAKPRVQATNLSAAVTDCSTCDGDRFVVYTRRKQGQTAWMMEHGIEPNENELIEEMAPCPDCGPDVKGAPDPAQVREMMRR